MPAPRTTTVSQATYELPVVNPANPKEPEWSHEECAAYEAARECIADLMSYRNKWIFQEKRKPEPDLSSIARWDQQAKTYYDEIQRLSLKDHEGIARVRRIYGAECRRLMADPDART